MIKFSCPHCEQKLSIEKNLAGTEAHCPACRNEVLIPHKSQTAATTNIEQLNCPLCNSGFKIQRQFNDSTVNCPSCQEQILIPGNGVKKTNKKVQNNNRLKTNKRTTDKKVRIHNSSSIKAQKKKQKRSHIPIILTIVIPVIGIIAFIAMNQIGQNSSQYNLSIKENTEYKTKAETIQSIHELDKTKSHKTQSNPVQYKPLNDTSVKFDPASSKDLTRQLKPFMEKYCFECHNEKKQKGEIQLDNINYSFSDSASVHMWQDVLDVLNVGEMPPEDEKQPSANELTDFIGDIAQNIKLAHKRLAATGGKISMRYLTKREYLSSVTDLFGIDIPEDILPDEVSPEFDTIGSDQYFSLKQYEQFYKAGRKVVETNIIDITAPFDSKTIRFDPEILPTEKAKKYYLRMKAVKKLIEANAPLSEITKVDPHIADQGQLEIFKRRYNGKLAKAEKKYKKANIQGVAENLVYKKTFRPNSLYKISVTALSFSEKKKGKKEKIAYAYINGKRTTLKFDSKSGMTSSEVSFKTGLFDSEVLIRIKGHEDDIYDYLSLTGPFKLKEKKMTFFNSLVSPITKKSNASESEITELLTKFAERAFRYQGVDKDYITALLKLYRLERENGKDIGNSLIEPLTAILTAPAFLYIKEKNDGNRNKLTQSEFAVRMAYFLWRSPPDKELYDLAASNSLFDSGVLRNQFERMLSSNKADHFLADFINQWSDIERFDEIDIPSELAKIGFPASARREIGEFFKVLVRENLPVENLIKSDFVVADHRLAGHYGFRTRGFTGFKKFKLSDLNSKTSIGPRGGMLTQFAFLMTGSTDQRTSPTIRGTLIREKFLFDPPPPPPPNVPAIEPPEGAKLTVRQLVDRHMNVPQCASCHKKIDPIGLGLENFDYLGKWRTEEIIKVEPVKNTRKGKAKEKTTPPEIVPVVAKGHLDGESFKDFKGLQQVLLKNKHKLAQSIYESMLSYGIGRKIEFIDDHEIEKSLSQLKKKNYLLKEMVFDILSSQIFATK